MYARMYDNVDKITKLNTELTSINERVSNTSTTATRLEGQFKKMESKYEEQLKLEERTNELNKKFAERKLEQDKVRALVQYIRLFTICVAPTNVCYQLHCSSPNKLRL